MKEIEMLELMKGKIVKGNLNGEKIAEQWINVNNAVVIAKKFGDSEYQRGIREKSKSFPMIDSDIDITWDIAEKIYKKYCALFGTDQSLERIAERGGFGWDEVENINKMYAKKLQSKLSKEKQ